MKGFTFYMTYFDVAQELGEKAQGEFYKAIVDYMFSGQDPEETLPKRVRIAFKSVKANLKTSKKRSQNGEVGNAVKWGNYSVCDKKSETQRNRKNIASSSSISISSSRPKSAQSTAPNFGKAYAGGDDSGAADDAAEESWPSVEEFAREMMG